MQRQLCVQCADLLTIAVGCDHHDAVCVPKLRCFQQRERRNALACGKLESICNEGTILLPVLKSKEQEREQQEEVHNRMLLLSAARTGDPQAIESLTLDDMDTYSKVSKRLISEDVFTIVDTYIMPYGIECDRYSIMGEILEYRLTRNEITREDICIMKLDVNGLLFDVCVPKREVMGEPAVGRRFKGNVWLQGKINF